MEVSSGPRQRLPGTWRHRYRCSLPGLTGFTAGRRGEADADRTRLWTLCGEDTTRASEYPREFQEQIAAIECQHEYGLALLYAPLAEEEYEHCQRQEKQERELEAQQVRVEP